MMRVLIVEDSSSLAATLHKGLSEEGFGPKIERDGKSGLESAKSGKFDLVLLDINLPGVDGFSFISLLRQERSDIPVIMITARDTVPDRIKGLDLGADDYLVKPFQFGELLARIRALQRRTSRAPITPLSWEDIVLEPRSGRARRGNRTLALTFREFALLQALLTRSGEVIQRDELREAVWGEGNLSESNILDVYINHLRLKLEAAGELRVLHTVRGLGYVLGPEPQI